MALWALTAGAALLVFMLGRAARNMQRTEALARGRYEADQGELAALQARESELREWLARRSAPRGVEEELRRKFRVAREGEQLVIIEAEGGAEVEDAQEPEPPSLLEWLQSLVRGLVSEQYERE
jgi:hypothetical protein